VTIKKERNEQRHPTLLNLIASALLSLLATSFFTEYVDVCTGMRGYRGDLGRCFELEASGFDIASSAN
jgi:hypothetical protein